MVSVIWSSQNMPSLCPRTTASPGREAELAWPRPSQVLSWSWLGAGWAALALRPALGMIKPLQVTNKSLIAPIKGGEVIHVIHCRCCGPHLLPVGPTVVGEVEKISHPPLHFGQKSWFQISPNGCSHSLPFAIGIFGLFFRPST